MGKNSEIAWMQRLETEANKQSGNLDGSEGGPQYLPPVDDSLSSMNYHLDDDPLPSSSVKNAFVLPPKVLADHLIGLYLRKVHSSLPVIRQDLFLKQYHSVFSSAQINPGSKWLAVLNMVLAIGSRLHQLDGYQGQGQTDENIFFSRAISLNVSGSVIYDHDDLQQVQAQILMAFYFLTVSQVNRYAPQLSGRNHRPKYYAFSAYLKPRKVMENGWDCYARGSCVGTESPENKHYT